jgi:hypothetical protein
MRWLRVACGVGVLPVALGLAGGAWRTSAPQVAPQHAVVHDVWTSQVLPMPARAARALLHDIACVAPRWCASVGYFATRNGAEHVLTEVRRAAGWQLVATPDRAGSISSVLQGVSCPSATRCAAVGNWTTRGDVQLPLAESWNGAAWAVHGVPLPSGATSGGLNGVSCLSASWCVAVGWFIVHHGAQSALTVIWNGTAWSLRTALTPNRSSATLSSVSCASVTACMAVGNAMDPARNTVPLAMARDARGWRMTTTPVAPGTASRRWTELVRVSCPRAGFCMAAGDRSLGSAAPYVAFAESWNGTRWTLRLPVLPAGSSRSPLTGVSCAGPASCVAVGFTSRPRGTSELAESWNGRAWRVEPTWHPVGVSLSDLFGVSCPSPAACTASGFAGSGGVVHPFGETTAP